MSIKRVKRLQDAGTDVKDSIEEHEKSQLFSSFEPPVQPVREFRVFSTPVQLQISCQNTYIIKPY